MSGFTHDVGILTFHRCINYGSYWQAHCLAEALRQRGLDAVVLDHDSPRANVAEWRCALRPTLPTDVPAADRPLYALKTRKFLDALSRLPRSDRFEPHRIGEAVRCQVVVVGSDEVWNLQHPWYGGWPIFFGAGVQAPRLVSYAASFGSYDRGIGLDRSWAESLRRFSHLSVRDDNSRRILADAVGRDADLVLDPCLQHTPPLDERATAPWEGPDEPFVGVYGHNFSPWFADQVRRWAARRRLPLVSVGYRNDWADHQWLTAGPDDFARCFPRAAAVVTNFFHGCVFALRHATPFVCEVAGYRWHKIQCLLHALGAREHLLAPESPPSAYDARLDAPVSTRVLERIDGLRASSSAYLDRALA